MTDMLACTECSKEFKSKSALTQHVNRDHSADPVSALRATIPGAPRPGGAFDVRPLKAAPSGIPSVDYAIGIGGVPRGTMIEVFGPSQTGKTFVALTFSAYAQQAGGRAGFMDAERALQPTFLQLIPGLDAKALEYGIPPDDGTGDEPWDGTGEAGMEASRRMIASGAFDVWTIDSVHALTPRQAMNLPIGSKQADAALARMLSNSVRILEHEVAKTNTLLVWINHVKAIPQVTHGRDWAKPGGSALDYYCAVQLHVTSRATFVDKSNRKLGHTVRVKVHKSKVAQPFAIGEFDLFYGEGEVKGKDGKPARQVVPGVDIVSSWFSVLKEADVIRWLGNNYVMTETGERLGYEADVREALDDPTSELSIKAREIVYPSQYVA